MVEIRVLRDMEDKRAVLGNPTLEQDITFFHRDVMHNRHYVAALLNGQVVGLVGFIDESMLNKAALGMCFLSTHRDFRNQGIAKQLAAAFFTYADELGKHIACSSYEELGQLYLKHVMSRTQSAFPAVQLFERD